MKTLESLLKGKKLYLSRADTLNDAYEGGHIKEKRNVFVSHIPIMSNILRPQSITSDTFYFNTIDKLINTLYTLSTNLENCEEVERDYILQRIQEKANGIWDIAFETLNKKSGLIRSEVLGGSINFSSRKHYIAV